MKRCIECIEKLYEGWNDKNSSGQRPDKSFNCHLKAHTSCAQARSAIRVHLLASSEPGAW